MTLNHEAIRHVYPHACMIDDADGAFDRDGNQIALDMALVDAAAIELEAQSSIKALRRERNKLLAETDWVVTRAVDASNDGLGIQLPQVWVDYRQALRDLPANTVDPANPVWPVKPDS